MTFCTVRRAIWTYRGPSARSGLRLRRTDGPLHGQLCQESKLFIYWSPKPWIAHPTLQWQENLAHQSWSDREEGALYVQPTCLDVQKNLCTVSPKGKSCRRFSARATEQASPCRGYSVRPVNLPGRAKNHLHAQAFEKFNLLIYWFQKSGITYPTLQMNKIIPKTTSFQ